jgi:type III pantothenate kinase
VSEAPALLIDVGNSRLKWGLYQDQRLSRTGSVTHNKIHETGFACLTTKWPRRVERVLVSNVAGAELGSRLTAVIGLHCDTDVRFAKSQKMAFGVTNSYRTPRSMGVDRWMGIVAAYVEFSSALCVVDAGTAVTIDAVDRSGAHLGGQIIAGLGLMTGVLRKETSDIASSRRPVPVPGDGMQMFAATTDAAISGGAFNAVCGAIERAARTMRGAGYRPKIVLTGGDASRILKRLHGDCLHRPNLVLQGLAHMLESE